jgi:oxalate decarboxylase
MKHKFDTLKKRIQRKLPGGSRLMVNADMCPALKTMALATLILNKGGVREPHWHPNADELIYCVEGRSLITLFSPQNMHDTFTLSKGEAAFFPKGYLHAIENLASGQSSFLLAYDNPRPQDLDLSQSVASMSPHVLGAVFGAPDAKFKKLKAKDTFISRLAKPKTVKSSIPNPNKFDLERINPQIDTKGGSARILNCKNFPKLEKLALFSLRIYKNGIREPHWHPNADELNYVISGKARLTILSPDGTKDHFELKVGQGSIIPAGYFHHIENIGKEELHMAVYFGNSNPDDIGLSGALSAYSNETLASVFSTDLQFFEKLHKFQEDRMIVSGGG